MTEYDARKIDRLRENIWRMEEQRRRMITGLESEEKFEARLRLMCERMGVPYEAPQE